MPTLRDFTNAGWSIVRGHGRYTQIEKDGVIALHNLDTDEGERYDEGQQLSLEHLEQYAIIRDFIEAQPASAARSVALGHIDQAIDSRGTQAP